MEILEKLIKRVCKTKTWNFGGFKYKVVDLTLDDSFFRFFVSCELPQKGQSYSVPTFLTDFEEIIEEIKNITGSNIAFSVEFLIDGFPAKDVYLSPDDINAIDSLLNRVQTFKVAPYPRLRDYLSVDIVAQRKEQKSYWMDGIGLRIDIFYDVLNIKYRDTGVEMWPLPNWARRVGNGIQDSIDQGEHFMNVSDEVWGILSEPLKLRDNEIFVSVWGPIRNFLGKPLSYTSTHDFWYESGLTKKSSLKF